MKVLKNTMTARQYHELSRKYKIDAHRYPYILAIKKHENNGYPVTNVRIAETLDLVPMSVSTTTRTLERDGIVENVSNHGNRKDWKLTRMGEELLEIIKSHLIIRD